MMRDFGVVEKNVSRDEELVSIMNEEETHEGKPVFGGRLSKVFGRTVGSKYVLTLLSTVALVVTVFAPLGSPLVTVDQPDIMPPKGSLVITIDPATNEPHASEKVEEIIEEPTTVEKAEETVQKENVAEKKEQTDTTAKKTTKKKKKKTATKTKEETAVAEQVMSSIFDVMLPESVVYGTNEAGELVAKDNVFTITVDPSDDVNAIYTVAVSYFTTEWNMFGSVSVKYKDIANGFALPVWSKDAVSYIPFGKQKIKADVTYPDGTVHSSEKDITISRIHKDSQITSVKYTDADEMNPVSVLEITLPLITKDLVAEDLVFKDILINATELTFDTCIYEKDIDEITGTVKLYNSNYRSFIKDESELKDMTFTVTYDNDGTVYEETCEGITFACNSVSPLSEISEDPAGLLSDILE